MMFWLNTWLSPRNSVENVPLFSSKIISPKKPRRRPTMPSPSGSAQLTIDMVTSA